MFSVRWININANCTWKQYPKNKAQNDFSNKPGTKRLIFMKLSLYLIKPWKYEGILNPITTQTRLIYFRLIIKIKFTSK